MNNEQLSQKVKQHASELDEKLEAYGKELKEINDMETLKKMEEEVLAEIDAHEKELKERVYTLPETCEFQGTVVTRAKACEYIFNILDRFETTFQMTMGVYEILKFWKTVPTTVPYSYMETTTRLLSQQKYSGYNAITKLLQANALFDSSREEYVMDISQTYYLADKHNLILTRMDEYKSINEPLGCKEGE